MVSSGVSQLRPDARGGGPREMGDVMSAAKRFLSLFLSATLVVGMTPDCAYAKVTAQMLRAAASQLPSPAQGDGAP